MLSEALFTGSLSRRSFLASAAAAQRRPNILLLHSDDQRADTIRAHGNPYIETPNLDRLSRRGLSFRNCYNQGGHQPAVCIASRAMLLSGKSLWRATAPKGLDGPLLSERLAEAGYETFFTGKWHNGAEVLQRSFQQGVVVHLGGMAPHIRPAFGRFGEAGTREIEGRATPFFANSLIEYLRTRTKHRKPFFAHCAFTAPHDPRQSAPEYLQRYAGRELPLPRPWAAEPILDNGEIRIRDEMVVPAPRTREQCQKELKDYYALITELDEHIGLILKELDAQQELENTIIIFFSDNGLAMGQHGLMGKQSMYEHSLKVPLIASGPGVGRGEVLQPMFLYELYSRICSWIGLSVPSVVEKPGAPLYFGYRHFQRAIRLGSKKFIWGPKHFEMYDLKKDAQESLNLYPSHVRFADKSLPATALSAQKWFGDEEGSRITRAQ